MLTSPDPRKSRLILYTQEQIEEPIQVKKSAALLFAVLYIEEEEVSHLVHKEQHRPDLHPNQTKHSPTIELQYYPSAIYET